MKWLEAFTPINMSDTVIINHYGLKVHSLED